MLDGIHLTLMIGPAVPVPVSKQVLDALTDVQVTTSTQGASGFQLTFTLAKRSPLNTLFLIASGASLPFIRVVVVVTVRGTPEVLIDGVMTEHDIQPGSGGAPSTLIVKGEDLSRIMDYVALDGVPYPAMPAPARVLLMLAKYAAFGIVPLVIPPVLLDVPIPVERIPRHQGTDLDYILRLAEEVGYVFYLEPGPAPGTSVAYWGPWIKVGAPQPALNVDMDAHTNVESLSFDFHPDARELPILWTYNKQTKAPIPIPVPDISPLNPPLGLVQPLPRQFRQIPGIASRAPVAAAAVGMAAAARSAEVVTGSGSLDVVRYGRVLKARQLVGVRGAGAPFNGLHYVDSVTHDIKPGEYTQSFSLSRNGLLSTLPRVPA